MEKLYQIFIANDAWITIGKGIWVTVEISLASLLAGTLLGALSITIGGQEITASGADVDTIRRQMGMVFQKFHLFSHYNVLDNLCLAPTMLLGMERKEAEEKAIGLLNQVGLAAKAKVFPGVLSGGQQQRIAICRSLMMDPKVLEAAGRYLEFRRKVWHRRVYGIQAPAFQ